MNVFIERVHRIVYATPHEIANSAILEAELENSLKLVTPSEASTAAAELRQLVEDMLEVSSDGRKLAADLAQSIREIVNLQCDAIDARARLILAKANGLAAKD